MIEEVDQAEGDDPVDGGWDYIRNLYHDLPPCYKIRRYHQSFDKSYAWDMLGLERLPCSASYSMESWLGFQYYYTRCVQLTPGHQQL